MGRLDMTNFRYMSSEHFRILTAVEMGMKNHEVVPIHLITIISKIRSGNCFKLVKELVKQKLLCYEKDKKCEGYYLTYKGYDYLAVQVLIKQGIISFFGSQIGVGKESDVYVVSNEKEELFALKIHRLGRNSFRKLREKRDYHKNRHSISWLYLSRLAATKEFAYMEALHKRNFPVPEPIAHNRHCIVMELLSNYVPLTQLVIDKECLKDNLDILNNLYDRLIELIHKMAICGIIHCDFNEFNLLFNPTNPSDILMIDFPQIVSINHTNAKEYYERDLDGILNFFKKRFELEFTDYPHFEDVYQEFSDKIAQQSPDVAPEISLNNIVNNNLFAEADSKLNAEYLKLKMGGYDVRDAETVLDRFLRDATNASIHDNSEIYDDDDDDDEDQQLNISKDISFKHISDQPITSEETILGISQKFEHLLENEEKATVNEISGKSSSILESADMLHPLKSDKKNDNRINPMPKLQNLEVGELSQSKYIPNTSEESQSLGEIYDSAKSINKQLEPELIKERIRAQLRKKFQSRICVQRKNHPKHNSLNDEIKGFCDIK